MLAKCGFANLSLFIHLYPSNHFIDLVWEQRASPPPSIILVKELLLIKSTHIAGAGLGTEVIDTV